jgi:hypothetical protein
MRVVRARGCGGLIVICFAVSTVLGLFNAPAVATRDYAVGFIHSTEQGWRFVGIIVAPGVGLGRWAGGFGRGMSGDAHPSGAQVDSVVARQPDPMISFDIMEGGLMSDFVIRDVPEEVLAAIDSRAADLGLSRNEYLRRELKIVAQRSISSVTADDLRQFSARFPDLADHGIMDQAWR